MEKQQHCGRAEKPVVLLIDGVDSASNNQVFRYMSFSAREIAGMLADYEHDRHTGMDIMEMVLERFVEHFGDFYGDSGQKFYENDGRRYFMLFLKPIINGIGN